VRERLADQPAPVQGGTGHPDDRRGIGQPPERWDRVVADPVLRGVEQLVGRREDPARLAAHDELARVGPELVVRVRPGVGAEQSPVKVDRPLRVLLEEAGMVHAHQPLVPGNGRPQAPALQRGHCGAGQPLGDEEVEVLHRPDPRIPVHRQGERRALENHGGDPARAERGQKRGRPGEGHLVARPEVTVHASEARQRRVVPYAEAPEVPVEEAQEAKRSGVERFEAVGRAPAVPGRPPGIALEQTGPQEQALGVRGPAPEGIRSSRQAGHCQDMARARPDASRQRGHPSTGVAGPLPRVAITDRRRGRPVRVPLTPPASLRGRPCCGNLPADGDAAREPAGGGS
jgi:hypothetical protein